MRNDHAKNIRRALLIAKGMKRKHRDDGGGSGDGTGDGTGSATGDPGPGGGGVAVGTPGSGQGTDASGFGDPSGGYGASNTSGSFGNTVGNASAVQGVANAVFGPGQPGTGGVAGVSGVVGFGNGQGGTDQGVADGVNGGLNGVSDAGYPSGFAPAGPGFGIRGGFGTNSVGDAAGVTGGKSTSQVGGGMANAYGSNVSSPGGGNAATAGESSNQVALNQAAALNAALNGYNVGPGSPSDAFNNSLMHRLSGMNLSPGVTMGYPAANPTIGIGGTPQGTPAPYGSHYGEAFGSGLGAPPGLGFGNGVTGRGGQPATGPGSPSDAFNNSLMHQLADPMRGIAYGPHMSEAIANNGSDAAIAAGQATDRGISVPGFPYGVTQAAGAASRSASAPSAGHKSSAGGGIINSALALTRKARAEGGVSANSQTIAQMAKRFEAERQALFNRPSSASLQTVSAPQMAYPQQMATANPPQMESRPMGVVGDAGDLGKTIETGYDDFLKPQQPKQGQNSATQEQPSSPSGFVNALTGFESGNRNIANTHEGTSSGQAQGHFQITTGTWNEFDGPQTGYDKPLDAPYGVQAQIAAQIPMKRWDPKTLNYLRSEGYRIYPDLTLQENAERNNDSVLPPAPKESAAVTQGTPLQSQPQAAASMPEYAPRPAPQPQAMNMAPSPQPQASPQSSQSIAPQDPQANLYNKVAFTPQIQSGYQNFPVALAPDDSAATPSARRGGIISKALRLTRNRRTPGGRLHFAGGGGHGNFAPIGNWEAPILANVAQNYLDNSALPAASQSTVAAAPAPAPSLPPSAPSVGSLPSNPSRTIPLTEGNSLAQVLGTNTPSMNQIFGFNYPKIPPPQPLPYASPNATTSPSGSANVNGSYGSGVSQGQFLNGGFGVSPTGGSPILNDPAEIAPGVLPPLIPSGTVGNYASFNPAKRGGAIGKALKLTQKKVSRR